MTIQIKHSREFHATVFSDWIGYSYQFDGDQDPTEEEMYAQMERTDQLIAIYGGCGFAKLAKAVLDGTFYLGCEADPYADITDASIERAEKEMDLVAFESEVEEALQAAFDMGFSDGMAGKADCPFKGPFRVAYTQGYDTGFEQREV